MPPIIKLDPLVDNGLQIEFNQYAKDEPFQPKILDAYLIDLDRMARTLERIENKLNGQNK